MKTVSLSSQRHTSLQHGESVAICAAGEEIRGLGRRSCDPYE